MELTVRIRQGWVYSMRRVLATICVALMKVWQAKRAEARQLQQEIDRMKAEHRELQRRVDGLQRGDPNMIEKEAREQLGYVKPGEVVLFEHKAKADLKTPAVAANTDQR